MNTSTTNIKNIVINGGGPTLFNAYGALKQSNLSGIWSHESVEAYYGTSAGAILAVFLALQYSWEDLDAFIVKRPWQHVWRFNLLNIYEYYTNKGIYGKDLFVEVFGPLFRGKDVDLGITLKEFHEIFKKSLYLYAVNIVTFELTEFSHLTHPDMPLLDAVRASSALPMLFQPVEYAGNLYTDGGILLNYPVIKCAAEDKDTILGVKNKYTSSLNKVSGIFEYISYLLNMLLDKHQVDTHIPIKYELAINTGFIDYSTIFNLANHPDQRQALIDMGMRDALESIAKFSSSQ